MAKKAVSYLKWRYSRWLRCHCRSPPSPGSPPSRPNLPATLSLDPDVFIVVSVPWQLDCCFVLFDMSPRAPSALHPLFCYTVVTALSSIFGLRSQEVDH